MTFKLSRSILAALLVAVISAPASGVDRAAPADAGWVVHAWRWWIGDGRWPPRPVDAVDRSERKAIHRDSVCTDGGLFEWWLGDGTHGPRPVEPMHGAEP